MTRRRIIEGTWACTSCQEASIPGRERRCPRCGSPREADTPESTFDFGAQTETGRSVREGITEAALVAQAEAGADWLCGYCGAGNAATSPRCRHCNAGREEAAGHLPQGALPEPRPPPPPPPPRRRPRGMLLLALLAGCGALAWWGTREHAATGTVERVRWTRAVHQERFVPETREGWREELTPRAPVMPVNGRGEVAGVTGIRDCHRAQRGTRRVADGNERVCRTKTRKVQCGTEERCRRRDLGNGFAEEVCEDIPRFCSEPYEACSDEVRYREEPVYGQRCRYDTYVWRRLASRSLSGGEDAPRWPEVTAGAHDRLVREEQYAVDIAWGGGERHTLQPRSEEAFRAWRPGARVALTVNNFGQVTDARAQP